MSYVSNYEEICNDRLIEIRDNICKEDKLRMFNLTIENLIFKKGGDGIYLFFNNDHKCIYVGRCLSRSFVERIPAHFDARDQAGPGWGFRGVCKKIREERIREKSEFTCYDAAMELLSCYLYLINFKNNDNKKTYCSKLERVLIHYFNPLYNRNYKRSIEKINDTDPLIVILDMI
jgi:hypothetical protein